jgi:hypothetical protein
VPKRHQCKRHHSLQVKKIKEVKGRKREGSRRARGFKRRKAAEEGDKKARDEFAAE